MQMQKKNGYVVDCVNVAGKEYAYKPGGFATEELWNDTKIEVKFAREYTVTFNILGNGTGVLEYNGNKIESGNEIKIKENSQMLITIKPDENSCIDYYRENLQDFIFQWILEMLQK